MDHDNANGAGTLIRQLERRIQELTEAEDSAFGRFTRLDWILCVLGAIVLPFLIVYWFRP